MKIVFDSADKKLEYLNQFLEEQLCYIESLMKEIKNKSQEDDQGDGPFKKAILKEKLETRYWMIQDMKSVMAGEL